MLCTLTALSLTLPPAQDYDPPAVVSPDPDVTDQDNIVGGFVYLQTSPLDMITSDAAGLGYALVQNGPRGRLELYYSQPSTTNPYQLLADSPTSTTVTSMMPRPGTSEIWMADPYTRDAGGSGGVVGVYDLFEKTYVATIAVGDEPTSLAFTPDGAYAFGAATGSGEVFVIDCAARTVVATVSTNQFTPHAIVYLPEHDEIAVASLFSGNDTAAGNVDNNHPTTPLLGAIPQRVVSVTEHGANPLPDTDIVVLSFDEQNPGATHVSRTISGVGTILYNMTAEPGSHRVFVPNTEALNAQFHGEKNFIGGQVVENRVTIVDLDPATTNPVQHVSLDHHPVIGGIGTPTDVVFHGDGTRAYVVSRGSDKVVELVLGGGTATIGDWWPIESSVGGGGPLVGARVGSLSSDNKALQVYCEIEASFATVYVDNIPSGTPVQTQRLTHNPIPEIVQKGNGWLSAVSLSESETSSCASCHVDGHQDMLAWELSQYLDREGTLVENLMFEQDIKGPMLTQTLRGLPEVGPYHWRGEQQDLGEFNGAFEGLLDGQALGEDELAELVAYMNSLRFPPNPRQALDRSWIGTTARNGLGDAEVGRDVFKNTPYVGFSKCADCHQLPTGTDNQITRIEHVGDPSFMTQIAHLRGLADKLGPVHRAGGLVGDRAFVGNGLTHTGVEPDLAHFVAGPAFPDLGTQDEENLVAFLEAFDTGLSPATAYLTTIDPADRNRMVRWGEIETFVRARATERVADFVLMTRISDGNGNVFPATAVWDADVEAWRSPSLSLPTSSFQDLDPWIVDGNPVTVMGMPAGSGTRFAIDADGDGLLDNDETLTNPYVADTDGDGRVDGQEVRHGTDPNLDDAAADATSPTVLSKQVLYTTSNTSRVELNVDEPARAIAAGVVGIPVAFVTNTPDDLDYHTTLQVTLQELPFQYEAQFWLGTGTLPIMVVLEDRAGNTTSEVISVTPAVRGDVIKVDDISSATFYQADQSLEFFVTLKLGTLPLFPRSPTSHGFKGYEVSCNVTLGQMRNGEFQPILALPQAVGEMKGGSDDVLVSVGLSTAMLSGLKNPYVAIAVHDVLRPDIPGAPPYVGPQAFKKDFKILPLHKQ